MKPVTRTLLAAAIFLFVGCTEKASDRRTSIASPDLGHQKLKDIEVIQALTSHGSDLSKPHMIEHHFITNVKENGIRLQEWGRTNKFQVSKLTEGEWESKRYFYFDLTKATIPTIENIFPDTCHMLRLADEFDCTYDGWGCNVVK